MSAPAYTGLSIAPEQTGCVDNGASVTCSAAAPGTNGIMWGDARISAAANTPLGYAGLVTVTTPGGGRATVPLWIISSARGSDLEVRTTDASGRIGDTVTVTVTVTNRGPSPQPYWGIGGLKLPGAKLVGQRGCASATLRGVFWQCAHTAVTPVGGRTVVSFDIKLTGPDQPGYSTGFDLEWYLGDPNHANEDQSFVLGRTGSAPPPNTGGGSGSGGAGSGGSSAGGSGSGGAVGPAPAASPSPVPSTSPLAVAYPATVTTPTADAGVRLAGADAPLDSEPVRWPWFAGIAGIVVIAAGGAGLLYRRKAATVTAPVDPAE